MIILYSTAAFALGFTLDLILGDPQGFPHIIRAVGALISGSERVLRRVFPKTSNGEFYAGLALCVFVSLICFIIPFAVLCVLYKTVPAAGLILESILCYQLIAAKCLKDEGMRVYSALFTHDTELARERISMLVGRDTDELDDNGITRAAVETISENTSDGICAPMLFTALGGAALGLLYKAVNTMDSMIGYKNERYMYFGKAAAKLDDFLNFIPSRLSAVLMIISTMPLRQDTRGAVRVWRRDRKNHDSPNSAQTESVCAGALGIRLAGPAKYFSVVKDKPYIGDNTREVTPEDIKSANRLMYGAAVLTFILAIIIRGVYYAAI